MFNKINVAANLYTIIELKKLFLTFFNFSILARQEKR